MDQPWNYIHSRLLPQKPQPQHTPNFIPSEEAQELKLKYDNIGDWLASHEPYQSPLSEQSVCKTGYVTDPFTFADRTASRRAMTLPSEGFAMEQPCEMSARAMSESHSHQPSTFPPCITPEYLDFARQDMAGTIPRRFRTAPPTSHPHRIYNSIQSTLYSEAENQLPFFGDGSSLVWREIDEHCEESEVASLQHGSSLSVSEENNAQDRTFEEASSATTPMTVPSYCSSDSYFDLTISPFVGISANVARECHDRWPSQPASYQSSMGLSTKPVSTKNNGHTDSLNLHNDAHGATEFNFGWDQSGRLGYTKPSGHPSRELPQGGTIQAVEQMLGRTSLNTTPSYSTHLGTLPGGLAGNLRPQSSQRSQSNEKGCPSGLFDCAIALSTTFSNPEPKVQANGLVTSGPDSLLCKKVPEHPVDTAVRKPPRAHGSRKDDILIRLRHAGISYKDIKAIGQFTEAESTLRGRFRSLTKKKEQRVRKPQWREQDVCLPAPYSL